MLSLSNTQPIIETSQQRELQTLLSQIDPSERKPRSRHGFHWTTATGDNNKTTLQHRSTTTLHAARAKTGSAFRHRKCVLTRVPNVYCVWQSFTLSRWQLRRSAVSNEETVRVRRQWRQHCCYAASPQPSWRGSGARMRADAVALRVRKLTRFWIACFGVRREAKGVHSREGFMNEWTDVVGIWCWWLFFLYVL